MARMVGKGTVGLWTSRWLSSTATHAHGQRKNGLVLEKWVMFTACEHQIEIQ